MYIYIYIYVYIHKYIYIYVYIYICVHRHIKKRTRKTEKETGIKREAAIRNDPWRPKYQLKYAFIQKTRRKHREAQRLLSCIQQRLSPYSEE